VADDAIMYEEVDLENPALPKTEYDLVVLIWEISKSLRPSGRLVCSVGHPLFTAPTTQRMWTCHD
jgi:hypothetical protein